MEKEHIRKGLETRAAFRLLLITAGSIFISEALVMVFLSFFVEGASQEQAFIDSFLLVILLLPMLYLFLYRPMNRNILERRQAERALGDSEKKYRSLVESTEASIYLIDRDCKYLFMNRKHLSRLGISEAWYAGRAYGEVHSPAEAAWFAERVRKVFETNRSYQYEKSDGDGRHFLLTLSPVREPDGMTEAVTVVSKDITPLKRMEEKLRALSFADELTGLLNRRGFLSMAQRQLEAAARLQKQAFILYADVDELKVINDTRGHQAGDLALLDIAGLLRDTYRESDIMGRLGGDEFAVLLMDSGESPEKLASRLVENLRAYNSQNELNYNLMLSVGTARYDPERPASIEELLVRADKMMYERKRHKHIVEFS